MQRDPRLVRLSEEHHHGLVFALRLERELPDAGDAELAALYGDLLRFWARGLLPHFHAETECLMARLVRHVPDDDERVRRIQRDHLGMEALVARMRDASGDEERRDALATFGETLRTHIRWEERVLFESLQTDLSEAELDAAGAEILAAGGLRSLERPDAKADSVAVGGELAQRLGTTRRRTCWRCASLSRGRIRPYARSSRADDVRRFSEGR